MRYQIRLLLCTGVNTLFFWWVIKHQLVTNSFTGTWCVQGLFDINFVFFCIFFLLSWDISWFSSSHLMSRLNHTKPCSSAGSEERDTWSWIPNLIYYYLYLFCVGGRGLGGHSSMNGNGSLLRWSMGTAFAFSCPVRNPRILNVCTL